MIEPLEKKWRPQATPKSRKHEIEQCLAEFGFMPNLAHLLRRPSVVGSEESHSRRLREVLESLGPVFSTFGLYMSSRVDLLPVDACLDLAIIADQGEAAPMATIRELIAQEFACPPEEIYTVFEEEPFESWLVVQSHRA
jgi:ubiquinone biosynthesis protein